MAAMISQERLELLYLWMGMEPLIVNNTEGMNRASSVSLIFFHVDVGVWQIIEDWAVISHSGKCPNLQISRSTLSAHR